MKSNSFHRKIEDEEDHRTRRTVIKTGTAGLIGLGGIGITPVSADTHAEPEQRPTLSASSPECETVELTRNDRGPREVTVELVGENSSMTATVERGENRELEIEPGSYEVSIVERYEPGFVIDGSPLEVEECLPPGIHAELQCDIKPPLKFRNPLDQTVWLDYVQIRHNGPDTYGSDPLSSYEIARYHVPTEDGYTDRYEYTVYTYPNREQNLPINGQPGTLVADKPCEELEIPER